MDKVYDVLTNSAKYALEDILKEYQENLLGEAYMNSSIDKHGNREISILDIYYAKEKIEQKSESIKRRLNKQKRFYSILVLSGIVYAMIGILVFIVQNSFFDIHRDLGILTSIIGLFITVISYFLYKMHDQTDRDDTKELHLMKNNYIDDFVVVRLWSQIEKLGIQLMRIDNLEVDHANASSVFLYLNSILTAPSDSIKLKDILQTRNEIVHGKAEGVSKVKIEEVVAMENMFIEKLEQVLMEKKMKK